MENKNKRVLIMVIVLVIMFAVIGSTLAYFSWVTSEEQQTSVTFTAESDFSCSADGGGDITSSDVMLAPSTCTNSEYAIQREVKVMPTINSTGKTVYMDLWLDVNVLDTGLSESENFMYALTTDENSCSTGIVKSGNFKGLSTGEQVLLLDQQEYTASTTDTYYLYIWLDAAETSSSTMDQSFDLSLNGSCADQKIIKPNFPELDEGMIPVVISDDGTVTTVSKNDDSWYNYNNKKWANAVLVKESGTQTRSYYQQNLSNKVTVDQDDILAYYVWIPRYKYEIWTTTNSSSGKEQPINIVFQDVDELAEGSAVGEYLTHPAFDFGGEQLAGIWVGKFETTQGKNSDIGTDDPTVLPNVVPSMYLSVSNLFQLSLKFSGGTLTNGVVSFAGSSTYGLASTTDSHMLKGVDWGAVAYLSHSMYGLNGEIRTNNNSGYKTGCGAEDGVTTSSSTCTLAFGSGISSYPQSTTGNISGIFDMSGGVWDYTLGVLSDSDGNPRSGDSTTNNSGFNGMLSDDTMYEDGIDFPPSKYYNLYMSENVLTACNGRVCYGHALSENNGWYSDFNGNFISVSSPWLRRGGYTTLNGVFMVGGNYGSGNKYLGSVVMRSVLVVR